MLVRIIVNLCIFLYCFPLVCLAAPVLNFSDIISGPATGLNDGSGEGAIVTVWGNRLGSSQGDSTITVCGSAPAHVYYWKNADGRLPGGPADLHSSHEMQEIAFSIPSSCSDGTTTISVTVNGETSNSLPFTVRSGNIYHAMTTGSSSGTGSYSNPWGSYDDGGSMSAGDILYFHHSVQEINTANGNTGLYPSGLQGTLANQIAFVAYPNSVYIARGNGRGVDPYLSRGLVLSKLRVESSAFIEPESGSTSDIGDSTSNGTGIKGTQNGRIVANEITDIAGMCSSGGSGAIMASGSYNYTGNLKILGNYIHDWGCPQTSHFEHTTYVSIRNNGSENVAPWEMGWNHLKDNYAKYGLHNYDETYGSDCGSPTGVVKIHDNYVINQKGAGISIGAEAPEGVVCWDQGSFDVYNNVIIEAGKGPEYTPNHSADTKGIHVRDYGISSPIRIYNNTIYSWGDDTDGVSAGIDIDASATRAGLTPVTITNNILYDTRGGAFTDVTDNLSLSGSNNLVYSSAGASVIDGELTGTIYNNPDFVSISNLQITAESSAVNAGSPSINSSDILSIPRSSVDVGAYEYGSVSSVTLIQPPPLLQID